MSSQAQALMFCEKSPVKNPERLISLVSIVVEATAMGASIMGNGDVRIICLSALLLLSGKYFYFVVHCIACGYLLVGSGCGLCVVK